MEPTASAPESTPLEKHLEAALENAESDTVRYHLRESLQMVYGQAEE